MLQDTCLNKSTLSNKQVIDRCLKMFSYPVLSLTAFTAIYLHFCLGTVHKRRPYKLRKLTPPPYLQSVRTGSNSLSCPCEYTIYFKKSKVFCTKKYRRPHLKSPSLPLSEKMSALDKPPPPDCERILWTAPDD